MTRLLAQLDPSDPLNCLVALQLLQEIVISGGPAAHLMQQLMLPTLLQLMDDPATAAGAMPIAARLVAATVMHGNAAAVHGNGVSAMDVDGGAGAATAVLARMQDVLDDRYDCSERTTEQDAATPLLHHVEASGCQIIPAAYHW